MLIYSAWQRLEGDATQVNYMFQNEIYKECFGTSLIKICQALRELWTFEEFKMADIGVAVLNI